MYHDQELVKEVAGKILKLDRFSQALIRTELKGMFEYAKEDVAKISAYTAPEDAKNRRDILEYYTDLLDLLKTSRRKWCGKNK